MKRETFIAETARLIAAFPAGEFTDATGELWWTQLHFLPAKVFSAGITKLILNRKFSTLPTVADIADACVGGHYHVIPSHQRGSGDATVDEIMSAYRLKYENRQLEIQAPANQKLLGVAENPSLPSRFISSAEIIEQLKTKLADLERDNRMLSSKYLSAEAEVIELTRQCKDLSKRLDTLGKAMAKVETMNRELKLNHG